MRSNLHLRSRTRRRQRERGSILVICMVLAGLGTIGVAAWVALLDARANQVEANIAGVERKAVTRNSRALALHALYTNHLHSEVPITSPRTYTLPDGLGSCTLGSYPTAPLSEATALRVTRSGATAVRSHTTDVEVRIPDGTGTTEWQYQMRSSSPAIGGDLLSLHPPVDHDDPAPLVDGSLIVEGRAVLWDARATDLAGGFRAEQVLLPEGVPGTSTLAAPDGTSRLPLNYPSPRQTGGFDGSGQAYNGHLEIFADTPNPHNSYQARAEASGTYQTLSGDIAVALGDGPDTRPSTGSEAEVSTIIATEPPETLAEKLEPYSPLSSTSLLEVLAKTGPALTEAQLLDVFDDQGLLPDDILTEIASTYDDRIGDDADADIGRTNGALYMMNGAGKAHVFLEQSTLPHLILENIDELRVHGQDSPVSVSAAAAMPPRILLVRNDSTIASISVRLTERNSRPIVLAIDSEVPGGAAGQFTFSGGASFPEWHTVVELRNTTAAFDASAVSEAILIGGLRSNHRVSVTTGSVRLKRQYDPRGLEELLGRTAWIEAFRL